MLGVMDDIVVTEIIMKTILHPSDESMQVKEISLWQRRMD